MNKVGSLRSGLIALAASALLGCAGPQKYPGDDQPTLASLGAPKKPVLAEPAIAVAEEQTMAAYRQFLAAAPHAPQRAEALRRLGDLEMDRADRVAAESTASAAAEPDYKAAIARYQEFLKAYPQDPRNDRVLYQLARAQEQGGDLEAALKTLTLLVQAHPGTLHTDEAQFRRGELLFAMRDYKAAEGAYAAVLAGAQRTPFKERALYMQGWSLFKQGRLDDALAPFFAVLDIKLGGLAPQARDEADLAQLRELSRADRELVEDSFRVMSIAFGNLQGADAIERFITSPLRQAYQFRVYQQLAELYIRQERIKDAADTLALFVRRQPLHAQAPLLAARVVEIYEKTGFDTLALQAKKEHVLRYGADSEFRRANPSGWQRAQPLVKAHLSALAQHHHALAQKTKLRSEVQEAGRWYTALLAQFPDDVEAPAQRFLLAELLFEDRRWAAAAAEYETVAYQHAQHPRAADAGYAALLAYAAQAAAQTATQAAPQASTDAALRVALQQTSVASALRFAASFAADPRGAAVLTRAAEQLFALGDTAQASAVAQQALALQPPPAAELRRTAWTVVAHQAFEQADYASAERAYNEVLVLSAERSAGRNDVAERLAAAIYKQGEAARSGGDARAAVGHFDRIAALGALPAMSAVRASAQFDAAAALMGLKDWPAAARALEDFRRQQPGHTLQAEVAPKLALAYLEQGQSTLAAAEFERVAAASSHNPELARAALWQAAELHQKAAAQAAAPSPLLATAIKAYERYVQQYIQPVDSAVEARWRLAQLTRQAGQSAKALAWMRAVQQADAEAGPARTARTRTLGGQATLALAEPLLAAYRAVPLAEPLAKQLKLKKAKMEEVLHAYAAASEVQVADVSTAATFHTAALYLDFGKALTGSARPKKLSKTELEQYNVMLEEQAFPFEEKAIELFEANARRSSAGLYDQWVQSSFTELAKLKPVRYGKAERNDNNALNQQGIAQRQQGHFEQARQAYEAAIAEQPEAAAPQLNLAILYDLYLGDAARAAALYQRCLALSPADAPTLGKWLAELKTRKPTSNTAGTAATTTTAAAATASGASGATRKDTP